MRRLALGSCLLAFSACATQPPDHSFPVFFTPFSTVLDVPATLIVSQAAAAAKQAPSAKVNVVGFADPNVGTPEQNGQLAEQRAMAVRAQLVKDGVADASISARGGGAPPNSQPGVQERRAEIDIDAP